MSKTLRYHPQKGWITIEEWEREKLIDDIVDRIMSDLEFKIQLDLKTGVGEIAMFRKKMRDTETAETAEMGTAETGS